MFAGLADFIARRHKIIIIIWIIALVLALPLAPLVNSVVQYDETEMAPQDLESTIASDYIEERFGNSSEQPTTLIVLVANDVTSDDVKRTVISIEGDLKNASLFGDIHEVEVTSIYGVIERYTLNVVRSLNTAYTGANQMAYAIYGLPQDYLELWQQTNLSAHAFYDVPAIYSFNWISANSSNPGLTVQQIDDLSYQASRMQVTAMSQGLTPDHQAFLWGWFAAFSTAWNGSELLANAPLTRASVAHDSAFTPFVSALLISDQEETLLGQIDQAFNTLSIDFANVSGFAKQEGREQPGHRDSGP